jgi:hypothetical protein
VRRANEALLLPTVLDRGACRIDPRAQCRFRDDPSLPHGSKQIVFADDAVAVADQVLEEVEDLRLEGDQHPPAAQLAPCRIQ